MPFQSEEPLMTRWLAVASLCALSLVAIPLHAEPSPGAPAAPAPSPTNADLSRIVSSTGLVLSADGRHIEDPTCGAVDARFESVDLNRDGTAEVFLFYGDTCTSGATGVSLVLFVKDATGAYRPQLNFPAADYTAVGPGQLGFPDLEVRGMGFCAGVWRWDGKDYQHVCNRPDEPGGCDVQGRICTP
jgi:hypothetical protein